MKIDKKLQKSFEKCNVLQLSASEWDYSAPEFPTSWRIVSPGVTTIHLNGVPCALELTEEDLRGMAEYHASTGTQIPIDSEHYLSALAKKNKMDESTVLRFFPTARGQLGACDVVYRDGALYAENVNFSKAAQPFVREAVLRYFSPVIRGLDGKSLLRMTSIALVSNPAIDYSEPLVASAENELEPGGASAVNTNLKERNCTMQKLWQCIKDVTGIALSAESDDVAVGALPICRKANTFSVSKAMLMPETFTLLMSRMIRQCWI